LKEYRRNYYREYAKTHPEYRISQRENKARSNRKKYAEDEEYRKKRCEQSKYYKNKKKLEIDEKLAKLELLQKIFNNSIDIDNTTISVKT